MKQISEQSQKGSGVAARREFEQQHPGDEAGRRSGPFAVEKFVLLTHGFSRNGKGNDFPLLLSSIVSPNLIHNQYLDREHKLRQVFGFREQSSRWIPSKIRGETRGEEKSI